MENKNKMEQLVYLEDIGEYEPTKELYIVKGDNYEDFVVLYNKAINEWYERNIDTSLIEYIQEELEKEGYYLERFKNIPTLQF